MISTNYNAISHFSSSPDNDAIILQRAAEFLGPRDMAHCECVCKLWRVFYADQGIWMELSLREGVPLVEGKKRDRRADFKTLYPITISGARISRTIGEVEGTIPCISEVFINRLNDPDPFEKEKLMKDTWVFVVDPARVKRTAGIRTPLDLDEEENLIEVPDNKVQNGKELVIPLSLKNLKALCSYPMEGRENMPVFSNHCYDEVFNQCGVNSDKTSVYFMRRSIVEASRNLTYAEQEKLIEGFDVTSLRLRALFDAIVILGSWTCPDAAKPRSYARCPDVFHIGNNDYYTDIGTFDDLDIGVGICFNDGSSSNFHSVVPSVSAAVFPVIETRVFFGT